MDDKFISFAQLARLKGVSKPAVTRAVKSGRIEKAVVNLDGKRIVNQELALQLWDENTDPGSGGKNLEVDTVPTQAREKLKRRVEALPDDQIPEYQVSRGRKEHYLAELAKLQVAQQKKDLVPVKDVKNSSFKMGRAVRESLSNLADRLSHQIAGETDATMIHRLLSDEHRAALEKLAEV